MFKVMALYLWRDRAALVMAFFLPPLVFLIFSAVFAGTTGADVKLQVSVADLAHTRASQRLEAALLADKDLRATAAAPETLAAVRARVRSGRADAGLVIRADPAAPGSPILILADPSQAIAAPLAEARSREAMNRSIPDVLLARTLADLAPAIGPLTAAQQDNVAAAQAQLVDDPASAPKQTPFIAHEDVAGAVKGGGVIGRRGSPTGCWPDARAWRR